MGSTNPWDEVWKQAIRPGIADAGRSRSNRSQGVCQQYRPPQSLAELRRARFVVWEVGADPTPVFPVWRFRAATEQGTLRRGLPDFAVLVLNDPAMVEKYKPLGVPLRRTSLLRGRRTIFGGNLA